MCGICGLIHSDPKRPVDQAVLEQMNAVIRHRGPDSDGFYINGNVGLAVRRLAIIDLVTGDQPIANEDGTIWIVFNGEIYNHPELRQDLKARGHVFSSHSDTETIVHLYEEYGPGCVEYLRGMFALAIWDEKLHQLLLARDRVGKKPLYYTEHNGTLIFGSEIKCLLQVANIPRFMDLEAIHHYLTLQYVPDPWTAFQGIHTLLPAHRLIWRDGRSTINCYWDLAYDPKWNLPEVELKQRIRDAVTEAVRIRLISDVPLGAHLSGGIDSSVVVGLMAGLMSQPLNTFSIGFREEGFSELGYARQVAQRYQTDHHEFIVEPSALEVLPHLVWHFDQPFADPAAIPTWYLAQMTRQYVTVALNGDVGDEIFAGYQRYYADAIANAYGAVPSLVRHHLLDPVLNSLPVQTNRPMERSYVTAMRQLAHAAEVSHEASIVRCGGYFDEAQKAALYNDDLRQTLNGQASISLLKAAFRRAPASNRLDRTLYTDVHNYLSGALLPKVDRTTMAHSLEARSPFLDHEVMELTARLPVRYKVRGRLTKWALRETFADLMPKEITRRSKVGFGVPLGLWFQGPLSAMVQDLLLTPSARLRDYFRMDQVARLLEENKVGQVDHGKRIWSLLCLEMWLQRYGAR